MVVGGNTRKVLQFKNGIIISRYKSVEDAAENMGVERHVIGKAIKSGSINTGYTWGYAIPSIENEFWIKHPIHEIECSSAGRIRRTSGWVTNGCINNREGYFYCRINTKKYSVARLIAQTFHENPEGKPTVDHIDRNRTNNNFENLRWATYYEQNNNTSRNIIQNKII